jgi:hypothetical protein
MNTYNGGFSSQLLRTLYNEELHNLYSLPDIIRMIKEDELGRSCSMHWDKRTAYRILVGRPEGKKPLGRPICKWENNIKMDPGENGWVV